MKVGTEDIRNIKPGKIQAFICENGLALETAATLVSRIKRVGMPESVVGYEFQKFFDAGPNGMGVILIHAMKEGDEKVLNK